MSILRYRLDYPATGVRGLLITNYSSLDWRHDNTPDSVDPPIEITVVKNAHSDLASCLVGDSGTWIADAKERVLKGGYPLWQLSEVEFHRKGTRLGFRCGAGSRRDFENLYISDWADLILKFTIKSASVEVLSEYTMYHDHLTDRGYVSYAIEERAAGGSAPNRLYEFGMEMTCEGKFCLREEESEYLIVTELC